MDGIRNFALADCSADEIASLRRDLGVSDPVAQTLVRRGYRDPAAARAFLRAEERYPPSAFAGISVAVQSILDHASRGERITIHGDYDVDGMCSTAVLVKVLRRIGADVDWYLPDRASDGYGLSSATVRRLAGRGTRLLVSADCAITAVEEVALARELGLAVVITDHHSPRADGLLPDAPIVHPAICGYPCPELCATAVAHKLAEALWEAHDPADAQEGRRDLEADLDLVALATIADLVPLRGENRRLARDGLRALGGTAKPGLRALMSVARIDPTRVDERAVGFGLAPRLNAAGRLYRADAGLELLLTGDATRAAQIAEELDRANSERRHTERGILFEAERQAAELGPRAGYVLSGEGWHPGVIGIVASRMVERLHRPVVLISLDADRGRGSGRSIETFDLLGGLQQCSEHLVRWGGHRAAAGVELDRRLLNEFAAAFDAHAAATLAPGDLVQSERVDALVSGGELDMTLAEELKTLAPFGKGNPTVSLLVRGARLIDRRPMGEGRHLRFTVDADGDGEQAGSRARAVAFGNGGVLPVSEEDRADATFTLEVNEWNGVSEPRLVLRHVQASPAYEPEPESNSELDGEPEPNSEPDGELRLFALS